MGIINLDKDFQYCVQDTKNKALLLLSATFALCWNCALDFKSIQYYKNA